MLGELQEQLRVARRASAVVALTAVMLPGSRIHSQRKASVPAQRDTFRRWEHVWAEQLMRIFGMHVHTVGAAPMGPPKARLVVANHRSPIDILVAVAAVGGCVLSRADLADWPLLGPAARAAGTIFVDRSDRRSGAQAIRQIRRRLKEGDHVIVFPEGSTSAGDDVRPFLAGTFTAARGLKDVEILPLGLAYPPGSEFTEPSFLDHMRRTVTRKRTDIGLAIGEPYVPSGSRDEAAAEAHRRVQALVHRARVACDSRGRVLER